MLRPGREADLLTAAGRFESALERDVEEAGGTQVPVTLLVLGVQRARVDRQLACDRAIRSHRPGSFDALEAPTDPAPYRPAAGQRPPVSLPSLCPFGICRSRYPEANLHSSAGVPQHDRREAFGGQL